MAIFFQPRLSDAAIHGFPDAIDKDTLSNLPKEGSLDWKRVGLVFGLLAIVSSAGVLEYHFGSPAVGEKLFSWTEKIFILLVAWIGGEATGHK